MKVAAAATGFGLMLASVAALAADAGSYPAKPIRLIAPFPAGGTSDTIARTIGQKLAEAWKQSVVIDNRGGVAGIIGTEMAAHAPADNRYNAAARQISAGRNFVNCTHDPLIPPPRTRVHDREQRPLLRSRFIDAQGMVCERRL